MSYHRFLLAAALLALLAAPSMAQSVTLGNGGITVSIGDPRYPGYYPNQGQYPVYYPNQQPVYYPNQQPVYYPNHQYYPQQQRVQCCQHHYANYNSGRCQPQARSYYGNPGRGHQKHNKGRGNCRR